MNHQRISESLIKWSLSLQGYDCFKKSGAKTVILQGVDPEQPQRKCMLIHCLEKNNETKMLKQLFTACSLTLKSAQYDDIHQALKKQKMLIWFFGDLDKLNLKWPKETAKVNESIIQHYRVGKAGSIMICVPAVTTWMNCAATKKKIWEEFSSIF